MLKKFHRWLIKIILLNFVVNFSITDVEKPKVTIKNNDDLVINSEINNFFTFKNLKQYISKIAAIDQEAFTEDVSLIALNNVFINILFKAFIEAISWLKNKKSFFFDKSTPNSIKNGIAKELLKFHIVLDQLNIPYGLLSKKSLNEKTEFIKFNFEDLVNYFKLILSGSSEYLNLFEDVNLLDFYQGKCKENLYIKTEILCKTISTQYIINDIHYQILSILGAKDGVTTYEQEIFQNKSLVIKNNIKYNYILNKLLEFLINNNVNIINEAKRNISLWTVLEINKKNRKKQDMQNIINKITLTSEANTVNYNYDLYFLQSQLKDYSSTMKDINCNTLSEDDIKEFNEFLNNPSLKNNTNFFVVDNGSSFLIIPRFNPLNEYKTGTIAERFNTKEGAINYSANLVAHHMIDDEIMSKLPNSKAKIMINFKEKGKNHSYSISIADFFKHLNIYSYDEEKVNVKNSSDEFFYQLNKKIALALIEAMHIYRERKSLINKSQLNLSDLSETNIVIQPFVVNSMTKNNNTETQPIIIQFNEIVYTILEYLEGNIISFIDGMDDLLNNIDDKNQKEIIEKLTEVITKNLIIAAIKKSYITYLYGLDIDEPIHNKEIEILQKIAIRSTLASEYLKRLLQEKRIGIQGAVEERRQSIYALQILCANKETKDGNISVIKDVINEIGLEYNIEILRNELINRQINFQSSAEAHHLYFNQIPKTIQDEYLAFIADPKSGNFYIGIFENFKELKSGNEFVLYILPKYDIRSANKKPGVFEKDVLETEIAVLMNNELYPYLQEIFKLNKEKTVILSGCVNKNDGKNITEEYVTKITTSFKNFLAICDLYAVDPSSLYVNLRLNYPKEIFKTNEEIQEEKINKDINNKKKYYLTKQNISNIIKEKTEENKRKIIEEFNELNEKQEDKSDYISLNLKDVNKLLNVKNQKELKIFLKDKIKENEELQDKAPDQNIPVEESNNEKKQLIQDKSSDQDIPVERSNDEKKQLIQDEAPQQDIIMSKDEIKENQKSQDKSPDKNIPIKKSNDTTKQSIENKEKKVNNGPVKKKK